MHDWKRWRRGNMEHIRAYDRKYYRANRKHKIDLQRNYFYGLTLGEWPAILLSQKNRCVCGIKFSLKEQPQVDHDHKCCKSKGSCGSCVRGALCRRCNRILAVSHEDLKYLPAFLRRYLLEWKEHRDRIFRRWERAAT